MWPGSLDMTKDECRGVLRRLELECYSYLISTFRAQGDLGENKTKLIDELKKALKISPERHRAEVRRAMSDEKLQTIAEQLNGPDSSLTWMKEGRRPCALVRSTPITALTAVANEIAESVTRENACLPIPANTSRSRVPEFIDYAKYIQEDAISDLNDSRNEGLPSPKRVQSVDSKPSVSPGLGPTYSPQQLAQQVRIQKLYRLQTNRASRQRRTNMKKAGLPKNHSVKYAGSKRTNTLPATSRHSGLATQVAALPSNTRIIHSYASPRAPEMDDHYEPILTSKTNIMPQIIATSKKDITSNLTKLQMSTQQSQLYLPAPVRQPKAVVDNVKVLKVNAASPRLLTKSVDPKPFQQFSVGYEAKVAADAPIMLPETGAFIGVPTKFIAGSKSSSAPSMMSTSNSKKVQILHQQVIASPAKVALPPVSMHFQNKGSVKIVPTPKVCGGISGSASQMVIKAATQKLPLTKTVSAIKSSLSGSPSKLQHVQLVPVSKPVPSSAVTVAGVPPLPQPKVVVLNLEQAAQPALSIPQQQPRFLTEPVVDWEEELHRSQSQEDDEALVSYLSDDVIEDDGFDEADGYIVEELTEIAYDETNGEMDIDSQIEQGDLASEIIEVYHPNDPTNPHIDENDDNATMVFIDGSMEEYNKNQTLELEKLLSR